MTGNVVSFVPQVTNREILHYFFERSGQRISKQRITDYFICERVDRFQHANWKIYQFIKQQVTSQFETIDLGALPGIITYPPEERGVVIQLFSKRKSVWLRLRNKLARI